MSTAKRYQPQGLIGEQGGVQTFRGRDAMNGLPVRLYSFMGTPTSREGELRSDFIPPVLSATTQGGAGEVVAAFSEGFGKLKGAVAPAQVERLLLETAAALDDAARAGVVHGDLSPERVFYDREAGGRFVLEGYGVPWRVRPSEFSAPERIGGPSFAGDVFAWARTVKHLSGPLPGDLRDLLDRCLSADPEARPNAREVRAALERYPFPAPSRGSRTEQSRRDTSAFEGFGDADEDHDDHDLLRGLTLLPKGETAPDLAPVPPDGGQPGEASGELPPPRAGPSIKIASADQHSDRRDAPPAAATSTVRVLPAAEPPEGAVRRFDATPAYRARLAAYKAKQEGTPPAGVAEPTPPKVHPVTSSTADLPEAPAPSAEPAATDAATDAAATDAANFDPGFDDVNERAPDPTLYRGGRRVLLLTLLGIALLVLVALQLLNA